MATTNNTGSFTGKVAFVTGAGSGIGRATALAFARAGGAIASYFCYRRRRLDVEREHDVAPSVFRGIADLTCKRK